MYPRTNRIREKTNQNRRAVGAAVQMACCDVVEIAGLAGYDFVWLDIEHGSLDFGSLPDLLRAAEAVGISSVVRVPANEPSWISRVLDLGASGVLVPHIKTGADA